MNSKMYPCFNNKNRNLIKIFGYQTNRIEKIVLNANQFFPKYLIIYDETSGNKSFYKSNFIFEISW